MRTRATVGQHGASAGLLGRVREPAVAALVCAAVRAAQDEGAGAATGRPFARSEMPAVWLPATVECERLRATPEGKQLNNPNSAI